MTDKIRSVIVKYVTANPASTAPQIIKALGLQKSNGAKLLMRMYEDRTLNRTETTVEGIDSTGNPYKNKSFAYTVAKAGTRPAGIERSPGYYRHSPDKPDHVRPTNQEGIGSGRSRVWVGSCAGLV